MKMDKKIIKVVKLFQDEDKLILFYSTNDEGFIKVKGRFHN
jgi:hypothetical protein